MNSHFVISRSVQSTQGSTLTFCCSNLNNSGKRRRLPTTPVIQKKNPKAKNPKAETDMPNLLDTIDTTLDESTSQDSSQESVASSTIQAKKSRAAGLNFIKQKALGGSIQSNWISSDNNSFESPIIPTRREQVKIKEENISKTFLYSQIWD